jgi:hypothetical protein
MTIIIERVCVLSVNRQRPGKRPVTSEISCVQVEVAKGSLTGIQSAVRSSTLGRADLPFGLFVPVLSSLRIASIFIIIINSGFFPSEILQNFDLKNKKKYSVTNSFSNIYIDK